MARHLRELLHRNLHKETWRWNDCQDREVEPNLAWPHTEPKEPSVGQGWFDERTGCLNVWSGSEWICRPTD